MTITRLFLLKKILKSYLVYSQGEDLKVSILLDVEPCERLIICYAQWGESLIEMDMEPVYAYI